MNPRLIMFVFSMLFVKTSKCQDDFLPYKTAYNYINQDSIKLKLNTVKDSTESITLKIPVCELLNSVPLIKPVKDTILSLRKKYDLKFSNIALDCVERNNKKSDISYLKFAQLYSNQKLDSTLTLFFSSRIERVLIAKLFYSKYYSYNANNCYPYNYGRFTILVFVLSNDFKKVISFYVSDVFSN